MGFGFDCLIVYCLIVRACDVEVVIRRFIGTADTNSTENSLQRTVIPQSTTNGDAPLSTVVTAIEQ